MKVILENPNLPENQEWRVLILGSLNFLRCWDAIYLDKKFKI